MPKYYEEQAEYVNVVFECKCGKRHEYETIDLNLGDNPYADVSCECGLYFKRRSDVRKNGGKEIDIVYTGRFL